MSGCVSRLATNNIFRFVGDDFPEGSASGADDGPLLGKNGTTREGGKALYVQQY